MINNVSIGFSPQRIAYRGVKSPVDLNFHTEDWAVLRLEKGNLSFGYPRGSAMYASLNRVLPQPMVPFYLLRPRVNEGKIEKATRDFYAPRTLQYTPEVEKQIASALSNNQIDRVTIRQDESRGVDEIIFSSDNGRVLTLGFDIGKLIAVHITSPDVEYYNNTMVLAVEERHASEDKLAGYEKV